jgi:hypothetical protein
MEVILTFLENEAFYFFFPYLYSPRWNDLQQNLPGFEAEFHFVGELPKL